MNKKEMVFPSVYEENIFNNECKPKEKEVTLRHLDEQDMLEKNRPQLNYKSSTGIVLAILGGIFITPCFGCGGITSMITCMNMAGNGASDENIFTTFLLTTIQFAIAIVVIWLPIFCHKKSVDKKSLEYQRAVSEWNNRKKRSDETYRSELKRIENENHKKYMDYINEFERIAAENTVKYAESQLTNEIIEWVSKGFCKTINAADRREHIDFIRVPYVLKVYPNKVECNHGVYDFVEKRCQNLETPIDQTAFCMAIAVEVRLNVAMEYPKDITGTDVSFNISYHYRDNYVECELRYTAPNGNFTSARNW